MLDDLDLEAVPHHPDDFNSGNEPGVVELDDASDTDARLEKGRDEAIDALRWVVSDRRDEVPRRDIVSAAEKLLIATKTGGFDRTSAQQAGGAPAVLFSDATQLAGLLNGMRMVSSAAYGEKPIKGEAKEVLSPSKSLPPLFSKQTAPAPSNQLPPTDPPTLPSPTSSSPSNQPSPEPLHFQQSTDIAEQPNGTKRQKEEDTDFQEDWVTNLASAVYEEGLGEFDQDSSDKRGRS